jgi:hypothetical protein
MWYSAMFRVSGNADQFCPDSEKSFLKEHFTFHDPRSTTQSFRELCDYGLIPPRADVASTGFAYQLHDSSTLLPPVSVACVPAGCSPVPQGPAGGDHGSDDGTVDS